MPFRRDRLRLHAETRQHVDKQGCHFADAHVLCTDAWMAHIVHQPFDKAVSIGLDMRKDRGEAVFGLSHAQGPFSASTSAPDLRTDPLQLGRTRALASSWGILFPLSLADESCRCSGRRTSRAAERRVFLATVTRMRWRSSASGTPR